MERISPAKDADGFHPLNVGRMANGDPDAFRPCTPAGIQVMLKHIGYDPAGQHAVIVGRSNIVGRPMATILSQKQPFANATVTIAHSRSRDLGAITRLADLLIVAVGWPESRESAVTDWSAMSPSTRLLKRHHGSLRSRVGWVR